MLFPLTAGLNIQTLGLGGRMSLGSKFTVEDKEDSLGIVK